MKILMVAPEVAPYVKVGGLADVVGALPKGLSKLGHDVRIVCPLYGSVKRDDTWVPYDIPLGANLGGKDYFCRVWEAPLPGSAATCYFLEHNVFFDRPDVYAGPWGDHADNGERFTFLSRAALNLAYYLGWMPDVVHCHDWTTGLVPVYLNTTDRNSPLGRAASVFTVHNLEHQGYFPPSVVEFAGLPAYTYKPDGLESFGQVNMMKGGLYHSTKITTVSPTYADEIQTPAFGCGLDSVLRFRAADLVGIINGIDTSVWDPANDPLLPAAFSADDLSGKAVCKAELQRRLKLDEAEDAIVFGVVSRLYGQKGLDLLANIAPQLLGDKSVQIALLGSGDAWLSEEFQRLSRMFPGQVGAFIGYNEALAHLIIAGCDSLVMPSRFEPCGLSQMYAMTYGSPPVVRATGGLKDSVDNYQPGELSGTGFRFEDPTEMALADTMAVCVETFRQRPDTFRQLRLNGMRRDFGWETSASRYSEVYKWAVKARQEGLEL